MNRVSFGLLGVLIIVAGLAMSACTPPGPRALLKGKKRLDEGRFTDAIVQLETATSLMSTNAQAWNYLGLAYHHAGRSEDAAKAYQRALTLDRTLSEARYNLGCLYLEESSLDGAKAAFTAYSLDRQNAPEAYVKLGTVLTRTGDLTGADKAFHRALTLATNNPEALTGLGVVRQRRGKGMEAAQFFAAALKQDSKYGPALLNYGIVAQDVLHDRLLAIQHFERYLALKPVPPRAVEVSNVVQQLRISAQAQQQNAPPIVSQAGAVGVRITPVDAAGGPAFKPQNPLAARTDVSQAGRPEGAAPTAAVQPPVLKTAPGTTGPQTSASAAAARETPLQVVQLSPDPDIRAATDAKPEISAASPKYKYVSPSRPRTGNTREAEKSFLHGVKAHRERRLREAIEAYNRAIKLDPSMFNAHFNLAMAAADLGDTSTALREYETALAVMPGSFDARYNFALLLKQGGYVVDAASQLERLVIYHPTDARTHVTLGNIYAQQLKNKAQAREHYRKALEADPKNPQASAIRYWLQENGN